MKKIFFLAIFILSALITKPDTLAFTEEAKNAYRAALALDQLAMDKWLDLNRTHHPDNLIDEVIQNYFDFFLAFIKEEKELATRLQQKKESRLAALKSVSEDNPLKKWALANIYLQSAAIRAKFDEPYHAALELRKAYLLLQENHEQFPRNDMGKASLGLLYTLIGSIPPQYQWVLKLASMQGDIPEGKRMLYEIVRSDPKHELGLFRAEALFFLSFIETNLNPDKAGVKQLLAEFSANDVHNPLLLYAKANMELRSGQNDAALQTLRRSTMADNSQMIDYLLYMQGEALLRKLDFHADSFYCAYIQKFKGVNYVMDAWRKKAWIATLKGDTKSWQWAMQSLKKTGQHAQNESDKQALREAAENRMPNTLLLKARLLSDGGYYEQAELLLRECGKQLPNWSTADQLEYFYRVGRVRHALNQHDEALRYYALAYAKGRDRKEYFAANALLLSGEIYESEGNFRLAEEKYKKCLQLKPDEYRLGIHARANAGLNRLANAIKKE